MPIVCARSFLMHIPSYQINNVIKVYSRQISQNRLAEKQKSLGLEQPKSSDSITISEEGKRQTIRNKVLRISLGELPPMATKTMAIRIR